MCFSHTLFYLVLDLKLYEILKNSALANIFSNLTRLQVVPGAHLIYIVSPDKCRDVYIGTLHDDDHVLYRTAYFSLGMSRKAFSPRVGFVSAALVQVVPGIGVST